MYCSVNGICPELCFLSDDFNCNVAIYNVYKINVVTGMSAHSWHSEFNSLQNVYLGFFII